MTHVYIMQLLYECEFTADFLGWMSMSMMAMSTSLDDSETAMSGTSSRELYTQRFRYPDPLKASNRTSTIMYQISLVTSASQRLKFLMESAGVAPDWDRLDRADITEIVLKASEILSKGIVLRWRDK